jgi:hypothetical protein
MNKDWKHKTNLDPETIADIISEGREENDKKFETYAEYVGYIVKENQEILDRLGSDYDEDKIPYWNSRVHIIEDFISADECKKLVKYFDKKSFPGPDPKNYFVSLANEAVYFDMRDDNDFPRISEYIHNLLNRVRDVVSNTYNIDIEIKSSNYVDMRKGSSLGLHSDMGPSSSDPVAHVPIITSDYEFSGMIYLNDDFEGGYLNFPNENIKLKTKPGTLVYFNGEIDLPHEVTEILEGNRKNIASFLRRKK